MNELQKEAGNNFAENNTQGSKLSSLVQLDDPNRQKPNLLRINADNQDKKFMCVFWSIFLVFVVTLAIVSKTLPSAIKPITIQRQLGGTYLQDCLNPNTFESDVLKCGAFTQNNPTVGIVTTKLSAMNQFAAFWLYITPRSLNQPLVFDQNVTYLLYGLENINLDGQSYLKRTDLYENETIQFQYTSESTSYFYADDNKTILGYKIFLGFIGQFPSDNLYLGISFSGPFSQFVFVSDIQIQGYKISKSFTGFTIAIRYVFFVFAILAAFLFIRKYRKIPVQDRIIEQKLIGILSIFLIFFNDPLYPITVLKENLASSFFSTLFVISFIVYLIFMWVIFYDRIYYEEGRKDTQQIKPYKIAAAAVFFILLMILYMLYAAYRLDNHPLIPSEKMNDRGILLLDVLVSVCFGIIMINIVYRYVSICCEKEERLWRSELFMSYSILFMIAMIIFIFTDNALGAYRYDGTTVIFLYGLMNFYVWYLQYMYSPTKQTTDELNQKRSLHSDQMMTVGTVQFNDLNINLDDNDPHYYGLSLPRQNNQQNTDINKQKKMDNYKWGKDYDYQQKQRKFSSGSQQDQTSAYYQAQKVNQKQNNKNTNQVDFFHQQKINEPAQKLQSPNNILLMKSNQTNLLSLSNNTAKPTQKQQQFYHPQFSSQSNNLQEIDQKNLQIQSEYQSQKPIEDQQQQQPQKHYKQKPKQEEGFGDFQLE